MTLKRILAATIVAIVMPAITWSQVITTGNFTVRSLPPGAQATLNGETIVTGVTPANFTHLLIGDYKLSVSKYGYETYNTRVTLDPSTPQTVNISLKKKTRFKAMARSLFIPGWGQKYTDQKTKSFLYPVLTGLGGLAFLFTNDEYNYRKDNYDRRLTEYDSVKVSGTVDELRALQPGLENARNKAYDAETSRRIAGGIVIGVWSLNLIDILFFFPEERGTFSVKGLTFEPNATPNQFGLTLTRKF